MDAADWDARYTEENLIWGTGPNRWVVSELGALNPGTALDLASGEGRNAVWLAAEGWKVTAIDFSAVATERGRRLAAETEERLGRTLDITWRVEDATKAEVDRSTFDAVLVSYLQLPAHARREAMRLAARALAPGGDMLVVAHDPTNLTEGYGGPQDPEILYSAADVEEDLQDYLSSGSLVLERSGRVAREIEAEDGTHYAWDLLVHGKGRDMHKGEVTFG
ncbi:class I SAM-dependent methyltransferase [Mobilicoccus pelagius]|uniref:Putative methyltransferase n=1 Tax=Mobilicoccus pelagius NBRC 104925 TaxID=1089455 RepID=H5UVV2_9MICO|nr:class I SAM-dependent methyltransferase [Mobilicoccus pelagius]GAB49860.1 putative methyltransferase [Mobilicoccus pelagius NBRC 104925]